MRSGVPQIGAMKRALAMLDAVLEDGGRSNVSVLARSLGVPTATAHRQIATLVAEGYLVSSGRGTHIAGARLLKLVNRVDEKQLVANVASSVLHGLAAQLSTVVQLGTLENEMVTYRIKTGTGARDLFTKVGMQLEAYCSAIGKVLLAHLPEADRRAYAAAGPFVALTERTIIDPRELLIELDRVRDAGFAMDCGEIAEGLTCIAVPIRKPDETVVAAVSVSHANLFDDRQPIDATLPLLREAAAAIEDAAFR